MSRLQSPVQNDGNNVIVKPGEVISIEDPYRMFRAQVRIFGVSDDKRGIPDEDLPWYTPMFPVTTPSLAGAGQSSALEEGSKVMVMILDYPACQHGLIVGSYYPGPSSPSHVSPLAKGLKDKGPKIPSGTDGKDMDLGAFGNQGITDISNNLLSIFKDLFSGAQIFKILQIFKIGEKK